MHRTAGPIDFADFGGFHDYGLRDGLKYYGSSKLHLCTYAHELSRRLNPGREIRASVTSLCPGAIHSNLVREAPAFLKPLIYPFTRLFFQTPARAAAPVTHACCAEDMGRRSGVYLHLMQEKEASPLAMDEAAGARLWQASGRCWRSMRHMGRSTGPDPEAARHSETHRHHGVPARISKEAPPLFKYLIGSDVVESRRRSNGCGTYSSTWSDTEKGTPSRPGSTRIRNRFTR